MRIIIAPRADHGGFARLNADRDGFSRHFGEVLSADPRMKGHILDVGCGPAGTDQAPFSSILHAAARVDGVDPHPDVAQNPFLMRAWCGNFEACDIPTDAYDAIVGFTVAEHVEKPTEFLQATLRVLKPGGAAYFITPNFWHPFAIIVWGLEFLGLKAFVGRTQGYTESINKISTYYRLNAPASITRTARQAGFASGEIFYYPSLQWDTYFPAWARWAPHLYDRALGTTVRGLSQLMMIRLDKPGR